MKTEKRKTNIFLIVSIAVLFLGIASCAAFSLKMYADAVRVNDELSEMIRQSGMEISMRSVAEEQRLFREKSAEERQQLERDYRLSLKRIFLENNRHELMTLVNPWNSISPEYVPHLVNIGDGMVIDERCAGALEKMLTDCRKAGGFPVPISAYRTQEYQQELFDNKVERVIAGGTDPQLAPEKAAQSVAFPGTSEHQLGLAIDIVDEIYPELDYQQQWTGTQQWLISHCTDYGFILRYPDGTGDKTGIIFEPWHYRYVGKAAAEEITGLGITLEEYLLSAG
ncbi:MAG: M15 family metallopeptidase [Eubacteriales bacterium]|nr:M15 family metallopeptidase [Eubacteriales bacterium]